MLLQMLKSKIHCATVTEANLHYMGSITIDEELMDELREIVLEAIDRCSRKRIRDYTALKTAIKNDLSGYLFKTTKRNPMILPVIMEI